MSAVPRGPALIVVHGPHKASPAGSGIVGCGVGGGVNRAERRRERSGDAASPAGQGGASPFARAVALFGAGDLDGAERLFALCRDGGLDASRARHNLGIIAACAGATRKPPSCSARPWRWRPPTPNAWTQLALSLAEAGDLGEARAAAERAAALAPAAPSPLAALAEVLLRAGDPAGAAEACGRALAIEPGFVPALMRRAAALQRLGRAREAEADLRAALAAEGARRAAPAWR